MVELSACSADLLVVRHRGSWGCPNGSRTPDPACRSPCPALRWRPRLSRRCRAGHSRCVPGSRIGRSVVRSDLVAAQLQVLGQRLAHLHGRAVTIPTRPVAQGLIHPGEPLDRREPGTTDSSREDRASGPRSTRVEGPSWAAISAVTRALAVAVVARTGVCWAQVQEQAGQPLVVGAEVEAPVRDAVRLIDDQQPRSGQQRQREVRELRVRQPLRGHQQHIDPVVGGVPGTRPPSRRSSTSSPTPRQVRRAAAAI